MAYDKKQIYEDVIRVIEENKLKHFSYIQGYVEPCTDTLYDIFPLKSFESDTIKKALEQNKINSKIKMVSKWEDSDNPTLQIAAFKLIATEDERKMLSTNWQQTEHSGQVNINPKEWIK